MNNRTMRSLILLVAMTLSTGISAENKPQAALCKPESMPKLPDVRITSVKQETEGTPHCKVAGVIGTETISSCCCPMTGTASSCSAAVAVSSAASLTRHSHTVRYRKVSLPSAPTPDSGPAVGSDGLPVVSMSWS